MDDQQLASNLAAGQEPITDLDGSDLPGFFVASDRASQLGQRQRVKTLAVILMLTVLAAISALFTAKLTSKHIEIGGVISGIAFLAAISCSVYLLQMRPERNWYEGRAGAESARTLAWLYAVGGNPFSVTCDNPDAELIDRLDDIARQLGHVGHLGLSPEGTGPQITDRMRAVRASSLAERKSVYLAGRLNAQAEWYSKKAEWNTRRENLWVRATLALQGLGLVIAIASAFGMLDFDLLGLVAAAAAATSAWLEAKDHGTLAEAYRITAWDLSLARERAIMMKDSSEEDWSGFVETAELAISREHTLWLARGGFRWHNHLEANGR